MSQFADQTLAGVRLEIDGNEYVRCKFILCTFSYRGILPFAFSECTISENCSFVFEGAASAALETMRAIYGLGEAGRRSIRKMITQIAADIEK